MDDAASAMSFGDRERAQCTVRSAPCVMAKVRSTAEALGLIRGGTLIARLHFARAFYRLTIGRNRMIKEWQRNRRQQVCRGSSSILIGRS